MQSIRVHMMALLVGSLMGMSAWAQADAGHTMAPGSDPAMAPDSANAATNAEPPMPAASHAAGAGFWGDRERSAPEAAIPWSALSNDQRSMLAPLKPQWDQLPPRRQQHLAEHARQWSQLPPEQRAKISERLQHWAQMSPEQRQAAARGARAFRNLPDADRQHLMDIYRQFQSLPPEQRHALMRKWREQHAKERELRESPNPAR